MGRTVHDAQFVYWRSDNLEGDAGGGNSFPIARLEKVKDKDAVYWTNGDRGTVLTVPKKGTEQSKRVLAAAQPQPRGIVANTFDTPQRVYWVTETSLLRLTP